MVVVSQKLNLQSVVVTITIFFIPFGVLASFSPVAGVRIYAIDVLIGVLFVLTLVQLIRIKRQIWKKPIVQAFGLFAVFAAISLLINSFHLTSQEMFVSFFYWMRFVCYGSLMFVPIFLLDKQNQNIPFKLYIAGVIFAVFGYFQYFFYSDLRNLYYLGWDEHLYRFFSTFLDPNFAAAFLVLTFVLGLGLLFEQSENFSLRSKNRRQWLLLIGTVLILPAIFLTYSRSGLIMFSVSMLTFLTLLKQFKWILLGVLVLGIGVLFVPKNLGGEGVNLLRTASINARFESYAKGIEIFKSSPIYGVGFNAYRYAQIDRNFIDKNPETNHAGAGVSNSWLFVLATTGIIGLILFLYFWFQVFYQSLKRINLDLKSKNSLNRGLTSKVLISCLVGIFIEAFFENSLFYNFIMVWVFLMIGFVIAEKIKLHSKLS